MGKLEDSTSQELSLSGYCVVYRVKSEDPEEVTVVPVALARNHCRVLVNVVDSSW